jgi:hypothetical protein
LAPPPRAGGADDFLHAEVADRLDLVNREFPLALDLGAYDERRNPVG